MQIWFYHRDTQVGDYVFSDASSSDILRKDKTVVGVCFYIDPEDKAHRLCVATDATWYDCWGLAKGDWTEGITLTDTPGYNAFDVPTITNNTQGGLSYITEADYRDSEFGDADGFAIFPTNTVIGELGWASIESQLGSYPVGTELPYGLINTLKIIAHRNKILDDSGVQLPLPKAVGNQTEVQNLLQLINELVQKNGTQNKYRQYYYPAASLCNSFEPLVPNGESLGEEFRAGKWFLPSVGEMARLYWYNGHNQTQEAVTNGIFIKAVSEGKFTAIRIWNHLTSNEYSESQQYVVYLSSGFINGSSQSKASSSWLIRPICAF